MTSMDVEDRCLCWVHIVFGREQTATQSKPRPSDLGDPEKHQTSKQIMHHAVAGPMFHDRMALACECAEGTEGQPEWWVQC